jgi:hypothetical protein
MGEVGKIVPMYHSTENSGEKMHEACKDHGV